MRLKQFKFGDEITRHTPSRSGDRSFIGDKILFIGTKRVLSGEGNLYFKILAGCDLMAKDDIWDVSLSKWDDDDWEYFNNKCCCCCYCECSDNKIKVGDKVRFTAKAYRLINRSPQSLYEVIALRRHNCVELKNCKSNDETTTNVYWLEKVINQRYYCKCCKCCKCCG